MVLEESQKCKVGPTWQYTSISDMFYNSIPILAADSVESNTVFIGDVNDDCDISDNGTQSSVRKSDSSFQKLGYRTYRGNNQYYIEKDNKDLIDNKLEKQVSDLVSKLGFPVAKIIENNGTLNIENLGSSNRYDVVIQRLYTLFQNELYFSKGDGKNVQEKYQEIFYQKGLDLANLGAKADYSIDMALKDNADAQNIFLAKSLDARKEKRFSEKLNLTGDKISKEGEYLANMLEMLSGANQNLIDDLKPLSKKLAEGFDKYRSWSLDIKPKNEFYKNGECEIGILENSADKGKIILNDFNRVKIMSMQEADALIIDAYLPSRQLLNPLMDRILPMKTMDGPLLNPFDEDQKQSLIDERIRTRNDLGAKIDSIEYKKYLTPARAYQSLRNFGYAIKRLSKTKDLKNVVVNYYDFYHNYSMFESAIQELGKEWHNDYRHFDPMISNIRSLTNKNLMNAIPSAVLSAAMAFGKSIDFMPQIAAYETLLNEELEQKEIEKNVEASI